MSIPHRHVVIVALGLGQILAWGTSFYFPAVFAGPIVAETGWSLGFVVSGTSLGLLVAGLVSPHVGKLIGSRGGRPVLFASSLLFASGLTGIGLSPSLPFYLLSWVVLGLGMATGLYDAVFAALGRMYGQDAREPITNLTLFGGFASTVCWPLSAFMIEHTGWRTACFIYAALHICVSLPIQMAVVRGQAASGDGTNRAASTLDETPRSINERAILVLIALVFSIAAGIGSIVVVHLLIFLQANGADFAAAVSLGALFGPAQVGARFIERLFGKSYHPIWTLVAACMLMAIGLAMLSGGFPVLLIVILIYGGGYGIFWIARGTVPLAIFGATRFPQLMGKLAMPALMVQALAPSAGAWLVESAGVDTTIAVLTAFAAINVVLIGLLWTVCKARISAGGA